MKNKLPEISLFNLFIGGVIVYLIVIGIMAASELKRNGVYSIAYTTKTIKMPKHALSVEFFFYYNGKTYTGEGQYYDYMKVRNGRYLVKFSPKEPKNYKFIYIPVPDSIEIAPYKGWKELPIKE